MYFCTTLFSYFFLFLNSLHMFSGLMQSYREALTRLIPAPLELAAGLMIHKGSC